MASSLQDLLFIDMISFWTSISRGVNWLSCGMLLTWGLNSLALLSSFLIVCIFPMKKSTNSSAISPCDLLSGRGFICLLLVMALTIENSCLESLPQSSIFFIIICCLWYTISQLYMFLSLVYDVQWWGCLYLLHALCLDLTIFCWPLTYLLNHGCLGLSEHLIVLVRQSSLVHCVVLCWAYCMFGLGSHWGLGLRQWSWLVRPWLWFLSCLWSPSFLSGMWYCNWKELNDHCSVSVFSLIRTYSQTPEPNGKEYSFFQYQTQGQD